MAVATVGGESSIEVDGWAPGLCSGVAEVDGDRFTYTGIERPGLDVQRYVGIPTIGPDAVEAHAAGVRVSAPYQVPGVSEMWGNDLILSMGMYGDCVTGPSQTMEAATFMHELGHNFCLSHGGPTGFNANLKPNYLSVMNYLFSWTGIEQHFDVCGALKSRRIDYSGQALPDLDETNLPEVLGIQNGEDDTKYYCPGGGFLACGDGDGPIDWNCDGDTDDTCGQAGEPACDITSTPPSTPNITYLPGANDWLYLRYDFRDSAHYLDGYHGDLPDEKLAYETMQNIPDPVRLVQIDVKPGSDENPINIRSNGVIPVAIVSTEAFDAGNLVDRTSVTFGRTGTETTDPLCSLEDVDVDGDIDVVCHFRTQETGLVGTDEYAIIRARTVDGLKLGGQNAIRIVPPSR